MKYCVYTDGACNLEKGRISASYMIRTNRNFITSRTVNAFSCYAMIAEIVAVGAAVNALMKKVELKKTDEVLIITDSQRVINLYSSASQPDAKVPELVKGKKSKQTWHALRKLTGVTNWRFQKIQAHTAEFDGNTVVDRLARYTLRYQCMKEEVS